MVADVLVVHYNEIALKLGHRSMFVGRLVDNVRRCLEDLPTGVVRAAQGRVFVDLRSADPQEAMRRLALTPGIANVRAAIGCEPTLEALDALVEAALATWRPEGSFRVDVRRVDKAFPVQSPEVAARIGKRISERTGAPVDLKRAESTLYVQIVKGRIYVSFDKVDACGGLPVSTGGRVLLLLSGGIDSPVAGLRMLRRGCRVDALHFHGHPYVSRASLDKAVELAGVIARGQLTTRLSSIAFGDIQSEIVEAVPASLRVVIYRRMMMRIASRCARQDGPRALVTGESLGQVASQTLANLAVIEGAADLPVLRPLIGMDKREITDFAQREETYEISIVPDQDCCTLFVPKHPSTAATRTEVEAAEAALDVEALVQRAVRSRVAEIVPACWDRDALAVAGELRN